MFDAAEDADGEEVCGDDGVVAGEFWSWLGSTGGLGGGGLGGGGLFCGGGLGGVVVTTAGGAWRIGRLGCRDRSVELEGTWRRGGGGGRDDLWWVGALSKRKNMFGECNMARHVYMSGV